MELHTAQHWQYLHYDHHENQATGPPLTFVSLKSFSQSENSASVRQPTGKNE